MHGDDYVSSGDDSDLKWLEGELSKAYKIKTQKLGKGEGCAMEGKVLNRILRCTENGWEYEADPRHGELMVEQLELMNAKIAATPGADGKEEEDTEEDVELVGEDATRFRAIAARGNYLAMDRPDLQFAIKEICREMSKPTTGSWRRLVRVGRYLKGRPRLVWDFAMQDQTDDVSIFTDSDWAGCRRSRKSTSGGAIRIGQHTVKTWAKTQAIVAKSSAEAELYSVVRGACEGLGMSSLLEDFGSQSALRLHLDSSAALAILERQGLSKIRHVDVNMLWLQDQCAREIVPLEKIKGTINPSDLMTKNLTAQVSGEHCASLCLRFIVGRPMAAAKLHAIARKERQKEANDKVISISQEIWDHGGGDSWRSRGDGGVWCRVHKTPRRSLFTPYRVSRGPSSSTMLSSLRTTIGVTRSGQTFTINDDFKNCRNAHFLLQEEWTGITSFKATPRL